MRVWWSKYLQVKAIVDDFHMKQQQQQLHHLQQQQQQQPGNNNITNPPASPTNNTPKFPNMKDYPHLLNWMNEQVRLYHKGKLPESSHDLLKKLGFNFEIQRVGKNAIWTEYYERLLDIKNRTGSCEIPKDYKDDSLRRWVTNQRQNRWSRTQKTSNSAENAKRSLKAEFSCWTRLDSIGVLKGREREKSLLLLLEFLLPNLMKLEQQTVEASLLMKKMKITLMSKLSLFNFVRFEQCLAMYVCTRRDTL